MLRLYQPLAGDGHAGPPYSETRKEQRVTMPAAVRVVKAKIGMELAFEGLDSNSNETFMAWIEGLRLSR